MSETLCTTPTEAARRGHRHYRGRPCRRGHDGLRYTISSNCVACTKQRTNAARAEIRRQLAEAGGAGDA